MLSHVTSMSEKLSEDTLSTPSKPTKIMIHGFNKERFNHCLGKLLTLVEILGLDQIQEQAFKSIIKQEIWDLFDNPMYIEDKNIGDKRGLFNSLYEDHLRGLDR